MVYKVVRFLNNPILERVANPVGEGEFNTPALGTLVEDMFETMYASHGIGLAAPQIDVGQRLTVIDVAAAEEDHEPERIVLINPEVIARNVRQTKPYMVTENVMMAATAAGGDRQELHEAIRRRAEEIYFRNGRIPGRDKENWSEAEMEILQDLSAHPSTRKAVIVRVNGVQYVGEYDAQSADGYVPGELGTGSTIPVRFHGDKMFVTRPDGRELETTIVKKIG